MDAQAYLNQFPTLGMLDLVDNTWPTVSTAPRTTALMLAAGHDDLTMLQTLLPFSDPTLVDDIGRDALMIALQVGAMNVVGVLVPVSRRDQVDHDGHNALMIAAEKGNVDLVRALIPGSDLALVNPAGLHAWTLAALSSVAIPSNAQACCEVLLAPTVEALSDEDLDAWTALLMGAAACGDETMAAACLARISVDGATPQGQSALWSAVNAEQFGMVEWLLERGATVSNDLPFNPLLTAIEHEHMGMVQRLLPITPTPFEPPLSVLHAAMNHGTLEICEWLAGHAPLEILQSTVRDFQHDLFWVKLGNGVRTILARLILDHETHALHQIAVAANHAPTAVSNERPRL